MELIVVIGLIGILAAIAVPSYVGLQTGVREASTRADLASNRTALTGYAIDNNGVVPATSGFNPSSSSSNLSGYGWSQSIDTKSYRYAANATRSAWCLDMTNSTGSVFRISTNNPGSTAGACSSLAPTSY